MWPAWCLLVNSNQDTLEETAMGQNYKPQTWMHSNPPKGSLSHHPIIPLLSHDYSMIVPISHEYHDSLLSRFSSPPASVWSHGAKAWKLGFWRHKWDIPGVGVMKCQFFKAFALKKHVYDTWPNNLGISHKAWLFSWETLASWFPRYRYEWFYNVLYGLPAWR